MTSSDGIQVSDIPDRSRFEIMVNGRLAGFAEYRLRPGRIVLTHTEIDDDLRGRGLAGQLVRTALDAARDRGLQVTPQCSYISGYIRKHPEYIQLVDEHHRQHVS